jgi:hypothetical protein
VLLMLLLPLPTGVLGGAALRAAAALQAHRAVQEVQRRAAQAGGAGVPHVPHPCAEEGQREGLTGAGRLDGSWQLAVTPGSAMASPGELTNSYMMPVCMEVQL